MLFFRVKRTVKLGLKSLWMHRLRSTLTALGIIFGVSSVIAMLAIGERTDDDPLKTFKRAVDNVKPAVEVKSRRVGGSNYQVPIEVRTERSSALALRWLILFARARPESSMRERLANELMDAAASRGGAFKKKDDTHRMAEANKAFAHYRW